nr:cytochrome b6-f complex subunit VII [Vacuolaria virescens]UTE94753.1 cytochrome b6-f complex subunit VII [Vacuolaria virescens]
MEEILTTSAICFLITLIGLAIGFVLLKVTQTE